MTVEKFWKELNQVQLPYYINSDNPVEQVVDVVTEHAKKLTKCRVFYNDVLIHFLSHIVTILIETSLEDNATFTLKIDVADSRVRLHNIHRLQNPMDIIHLFSITDAWMQTVQEKAMQSIYSKYNNWIKELLQKQSVLTRYNISIDSVSSFLDKGGIYSIIKFNDKHNDPCFTLSLTTVGKILICIEPGTDNKTHILNNICTLLGSSLSGVLALIEREKAETLRFNLDQMITKQLDLKLGSFKEVLTQIMLLLSDDVIKHSSKVKLYYDGLILGERPNG